MSAGTRIEWTERTWNPVTGCDRVSAGCDHCYALSLSARLKAMGSRRYQQDGHPVTSGPGFGLTLHRALVDAPRHWRKPAVVFVNSMSDLFHERIPFDFLRRVFATMEATPQHTYQILTKRATHLTRVAPRLPWPPNVWMGVTVEDQVQVDRRARRLCRVPAAVRFLSVEPMLGPVDLGGPLWHGYCPTHDFPGGFCIGPCPDQQRIHWVIAGGESGPRARPCELDWLRSLRDQCAAAGVPYFCKQIGTVAAGGRGKGGDPAGWPEDLRIREMPDGR